MDDLYRDIILDQYKHPHNTGWIDTAPAGNTLLQHKAGNASCGDVFEISILLSQDPTPRVMDVKWRGSGCAISTASLSLVSEWLKGKTIEEIKALDQPTILSLLGMDTISSGREKCVYLPLSLLRRITEVEVG